VESLSGVIFHMFRGSERHGPWIVACLEGAWPRLVGARIAEVCAPVAWERGRLFVEVRDVAWSDTLAAVKGDLLERIRAGTDGEVSELELRPPRPAV
jgi:hypothetical protein